MIHTVRGLVTLLISAVALPTVLGCANSNDALILQTSPIFRDDSSGGYWDERGLFVELYWLGEAGAVTYSLSGSVTSVNRAVINVSWLSIVADGQQYELPVEGVASERHEIDYGDVAFIERFVCDIDTGLVERLAQSDSIAMQAHGPDGETPLWHFSSGSRAAVRGIYRRSLR